MNVQAAALHTPLFLNGTNLSDKLDCSRRDGLRMSLGKMEGVTMLRVDYKGATAWVPLSNLANFESDDAVAATSYVPKKAETKAPEFKPITKTTPMQG
jgi:hypothetical protein